MSETSSKQKEKTYTGAIKLPDGTTEIVILNKILQTGNNKEIPLSVTYPNGISDSETPGNSSVPGLIDTKNHKPSYNCATHVFEAYFWLPNVTVDTQLCMYQNTKNNSSVYLTYHFGNINSDTEFHFTKVTGNVNLNLNIGDTLTIKMLDWRNGNPLSERTGDPITSRGTTTTVQGTGEES